MYHKILPSILAASMAIAPMITQAQTTNNTPPKNTNAIVASNAKQTRDTNTGNNILTTTITIQERNPTTQKYDTTLANFNIPINDTNKTTNQPQYFFQEEKIPANNMTSKHTNTTISKISGQIIHDKLVNTTTISLSIAEETYIQHKSEEMSIDIPYVYACYINGVLKNKSDSLTFFNKNKKYKITITNNQLPINPAK